MPIYLIRHGQSEFNAAHKPGEADPMIFDARLTKKGVAQAKQARIEARDLGIQLVISSPFSRALHTARLIFGQAAPIKVMAGIREKLLHSCDVGRSPTELKVDFPGISFDHLDQVWWHHGTPNALGYTVEPEEIFAQRIANFVTSLRTITTHPIAIVGHGDAFNQMIGVQLENCQIYPFLE